MRNRRAKNGEWSDSQRKHLIYESQMQIMLPSVKILSICWRHGGCAYGWKMRASDDILMVVSMCVSQVIGWQKQNEKTRTKLNRDWCGWVGYTHQTHHLGVMWCQSASNVWRHQIQIHCGSRYYPLQTISSPSDHDSEAINFGWHALFCPIIVATKQIQQMLDI